MHQTSNTAWHTAQRQLSAAAAALVIALLAVPANAAYQVISVTNGGTIDGVVSWAGDAPESRDIKVTKNQDFCGNSIPDPTFSVGPAGGLENVIVYLKDISQGKAPTQEPIKLVSENCMMTPRAQAVMIGTPVEISSRDPILHNVHSQHAATNATIYNVALPFAGVSMTKPLPATPGLIKMKSDAQEWMHAWIMTLDHPYYATTGADGRFTLRDVPPGNYTLVAWHEGAGASSTPVVVAAGGHAETKLTMNAK